MIRYGAIVGILLFCFISLQGQPLNSSSDVREKMCDPGDATRYRKLSEQTTLTSYASTWFDVTYYGLNLAITTDPPHIMGSVRIFGVVRSNPSSTLIFDLMNTMHVDSIKVNGMANSFHQKSMTVEIDRDTTILTDVTLAVEIFYQGIPAETGFGSFVFGAHDGTPWVWSLSEPYGARDWFPCKDHPSDKADSADIVVRCDSSFKVGSNGILRSVVNNGDGTSTHHWHERYPIASYLISVALTNYAQFSDWFHYTETDSMEILNYVLPEHLTAAHEALAGTAEMLKIFSEMFGVYPFIQEKYGHADFGKGGAMEHQTMTSTTTYDENTIAHELAHQWFGDMITCRTWQDLWLNEGFAQYATALYLEKRYGASAYWSYMNYQMSAAKTAEGTLVVEDTSVVRILFSGNRVYSKGASVLHMLRHVLGDSVFLRSMWNYANNPQLKYKAASTNDFQNVCEQTSGMDLSYFFNEWISGERYPDYAINWYSDERASGFITTIAVEQSTGTTNPPYFIMPVDLKLGGDGWDTTITLFNNLQHQEWTIPTPYRVISVVLDPGGWILKSHSEEYTKQFNLHQNYPNPFSDSTHIVYRIPSRMHVNLSLFNILGQWVATVVDQTQSMGEYTVSWQGNNQPAGVYFYRLQTPGHYLVKKLLLVK
jgi:aminopeptidase N